MKLSSVADLEKRRARAKNRRNPEQTWISFCKGTGCLACGCLKVYEALTGEIEKAGLARKIEIRSTGCPGLCENGPLLTIYPKKIFYQNIAPEDTAEIVQKTLLRGEIVERLLYKDSETGKTFEIEDDVPFYKKQTRWLLSINGLIEPDSLDDYLSIGGYRSLSKALFDMKPEQIIDEVKRSGLRGRGGGGFPTGRKWESCAHAKGDSHYVICNGDEGDPGAFMDRSLMEGNPHAVLEGMIVGARAIGGNPKGIIYVRNEYPLAVKNLTIAIEALREIGLLGKNILGSGLDFDVQIRRGGGAFVCGESTALMASLEGRIGEPRAKHIHTVEQGLYDQPSNLNNVETWSTVPLIINNGADWFAKVGTEGSKGTKVFSLVGKINNTGLVEVPMGITLREIVYGIGGGIRGGKKFKGVQTGGPSGGVLAEQHLDLPVDFESLTEAGSMMGSGGMIVMDEDTCMVDISKYFLHFLEEESCGKCSTCRDGIKRMAEVLDRMSSGLGQESDLDLLESLCDMVQNTTLCQLGSTAPNPVKTTMRYFRAEYEAHIRNKACPARVCKGLIAYNILKDACTGCQVCARNCPAECISGAKKKPHKINQSKCIQCGLCLDSCKFDAIELLPSRKKFAKVH